MHLLVTGSAGFIGSNFVRHVLDESDHEITSIDSLTYAGSKSNLHGTLNSSRHHFIEGDIRNRELIHDVMDEIDAVINFAAESHVDRSIEGAELFASTNVVGTQILLEAATEFGVNRFLQISTDEVYGQILNGQFAENDQLNPRNPYAATKAGADLLVRSYATTHSLPVLITRSSNNFGPRQNKEKLIPKLITRAAAEEPLPIYGDGTNVREWIYVKDNCRAIYSVLEDGKPGEVYNIGSGIEFSNLEVAKRIVDSIGAPDDLIEFVEDRPGHDQRYALDTKKIRSLGWDSSWSFDEGLAKTIKFYTRG